MKIIRVEEVDKNLDVVNVHEVKVDDKDYDGLIKYTWIWREPFLIWFDSCKIFDKSFI